MKLPEDLVTETTIYELYFDLWGFSVNWIKTIQDKLLDFALVSEGEECEAYTCEANMSVRFRTPEKIRAVQARGLFKRLSALASSTYHDNEKVFYVSRIG